MLVSSVEWHAYTAWMVCKELGVSDASYSDYAEAKMAYAEHGKREGAKILAIDWYERALKHLGLNAKN